MFDFSQVSYTCTYYGWNNVQYQYLIYKTDDQAIC